MADIPATTTTTQNSQGQRKEMADISAATTTTKNSQSQRKEKVDKEKPFRWESQQIEQLINCLISYK